MKAFAFVFAFLASQAALANDDRYVMLLEFTPVLTQHVKANQIEYAEGEVSIVRIPFDEVEVWSERVHHELGGCGGFLDVTGKIESGRSAAVLVWEELQRREMPQRRHHFNVSGRGEIESLVAQADGEKLWAFLTELSSMPDRSATTDNGNKAAMFLKGRAEQLAAATPGFSARLVNTGGYEKQPSVVTTLPGTDPSLPHVVMGGHMDTFSDNKPGADDDGSGSSVVMENLRAITAMKAQFAHTIHFIWYAAEERGLVGSSYVVDDFTARGINVHAAIQFDMTGFNSPNDVEEMFVITDYTSPDLNAAMKQMMARYLPGVKIGETRCGYACSDHANWHRAGIPVVFPFEAKFGNMNKKLHTNDDKITYLDQKHSLNFAKLGLAFLGEMAKFQGIRR